MNQPLSIEMRALIDQYGMMDFLTKNLTKIQANHPTSKKLIGWSPFQLKEAMEVKLQSEASNPLAATQRYNFYLELPKVPHLFVVFSSRYPALLHSMKNYPQVLLSMEFLYASFPLIEDNANAVNELADLLKTKGETPWFSIPQVQIPDDGVWREAILNSLGVLVQKHPRKFPEIVRASIHELGYDKTGVKSKQVMDILNDILAGN